MSPNLVSSRPRPRPDAGRPRDYSFPRFERLSLANGLRVVLAPVTKLPIVTVLAVVDAGAASDAAGREGTAQLTARMLMEGTTDRDGAALTLAFERLGAGVDAYADWDVAVLRMTTLAEHLAEGMELFAGVLRTPAFPQRELERLQAERLSDLLQMKADPGALAHLASQRAFYAPRSRYAIPEGGDEGTVAAITREDVVRFHADRYRPGGVTLVVVGDVERDSTIAILERQFGSWSGSAPTAATISDEPASRARTIHLVEKSDAPQSELRIGHVGIPRKHPDYFAVVVMNAVLGGLFSSRINLNLREAHGYTYGAFSGFEWRRQAGPFTVDAAVKTEVTAESVREVLSEIDRMRAEEITTEELTLATSYLDGVFPIRYETTDAIAAALANLVIYELPEDWFDHYRERVRSVTRADVLRAAQQQLRPGELQVVVVGDSGTIRGPLESLGIGPVVQQSV